MDLIEKFNGENIDGQHPRLPVLANPSIFPPSKITLYGKLILDLSYTYLVSISIPMQSAQYFFFCTKGEKFSRLHTKEKKQFDLHTKNDPFSIET